MFGSIVQCLVLKINIVLIQRNYIESTFGGLLTGFKIKLGPHWF